MNDWVALSLMLGIMSLAVSLLISKKQASKGKSAKCYRTRFKNHYWFLIINTSTRPLIKDDLFKPFYVRDSGIRRVRLVKSRWVDSPRLVKDTDGFHLEFEYMDTEASFIVEVVMEPKVEPPWMRCIFRDGEFDNYALWFGRLFHSFLLGLIGVVFLTLLVSPLFYLGAGDASDNAKILVAVTLVLLGFFWAYAEELIRPVSNKVFKQACRVIKNRKDDLIDCIFERWVERTDPKLAAFYEKLFDLVRRLFRVIKHSISFVFHAAKQAIIRLKSRLVCEKRKKDVERPSSEYEDGGVSTSNSPSSRNQEEDCPG